MDRLTCINICRCKYFYIQIYVYSYISPEIYKKVDRDVYTCLKNYIDKLEKHICIYIYIHINDLHV
jgi:hypothetical protein